MANGNGKTWMAPAILGILSIIVMVVLYSHTTEVQANRAEIKSQQECINEMPDRFVLKERYKCDRQTMMNMLNTIDTKLNRLIWAKINNSEGKKPWQNSQKNQGTAWQPHTP